MNHLDPFNIHDLLKRGYSYEKEMKDYSEYENNSYPSRNQFFDDEEFPDFNLNSQNVLID